MKSKKQEQVAIYARVATQDQNDGTPIAVQIKELRDKCMGKKVIEYVDTGKSGMDKNRSGLKKLLADAKKKLFGKVFVRSLDRIFRNPVYLGRVVKELNKNDVRVISLEDKFMIDKAEGKKVKMMFRNYLKCPRCSRFYIDKK